MQVATIGLDLAKHVFQIHGIDAAEKAWAPRGCGRWPLGTMKIARRRTAMRQNAKRR
jgi:hypothetical protein